MSNNRIEEARRRSGYELARRKLHSRPSLPRSVTLPSMESQQQQQQQQQQHQVSEQPEQSHQNSTVMLGSNMRVYARCRSRNQREISEKSSVVISTLGAKGKEVILSNGPNSLSQYKKTYMFDEVFGAESDQETVFNSVARNYIHEMLQGYNCTVFAYGQTGTGKTYTMSGDIIILGDLESNDKILLGEHAGIIPRVLVDLFKQLAEESNDYSVKISFLELYNERLKDLLADNDELEEQIRIFDNNTGSSYGKQSSFHNSSSSSIVVKGMEEIYIKSANEGLKLLMTGSMKRKVAATKCNDLSSRSHTVFTITTNISRTDPVSGKQYIKIGKLSLVDLAGSENINRSGAENKRAQEAGLINKSLLTLGRVINALVDHSQHIPYRESKLTRLLQDSLGGKTKTCIIATISPAKICMDETVSTLEYAARARSIKNTPQISQSMSKNSCIAEYINEIDRLRQELRASRLKEGMYITQEQNDLYESNGILVEEQKVRIQNMEEQIKKFKEKYVEQTNLNRVAEQRLEESELARNKLETQKRDILTTFNHYQYSCNDFVEKVSDIHNRNLAVISALNAERNNMHNISSDYKKVVGSIFETLATKTAELSTVNVELDSHTAKFKEVTTNTLKEMAHVIYTHLQVIDKELATIDPENYAIPVHQLHSSLESVLSKFQETPWDKEAAKLYAHHRQKIDTYSRNINECQDLQRDSIMEILAGMKDKCTSSIIDIRQMGVQHIESLFRIIGDQEESLIKLKQELRDKKESLQKCNAVIAHLQEYFDNRVKNERANIFSGILNYIKDAERDQIALDTEILHHTIGKFQESNANIIGEQVIDLEKVRNHASKCLEGTNNYLENFKLALEEVSQEQENSLDKQLPLNAISDSFGTLSHKVSVECDEVSSQDFLKLTRGLGSKIVSSSNILKSDLGSIVGEAKHNIARQSKKDQAHVHKAIRESKALSESIMKTYQDKISDVLTIHNSTMIKFSDELNTINSSLRASGNADTIPALPDMAVDVEERTIRSLPKLNSPTDCGIYEDLYESSKEMAPPLNSRSPICRRLVFSPSTPVPVPDQPLPRVLAPRSINSTVKRSSTHASDMMKPHVFAMHTGNDLKRKFATDPDDFQESKEEKARKKFTRELRY